MDMILSLVSKPFSLASLIFLAGVRSVSLATLAWWHLLKGIVDFHVDLVLIWIVALVSPPVRIFTALQRERTLRREMCSKAIKDSNCLLGGSYQLKQKKVLYPGNL